MVWVRSEYAGELAVLAAWASALIPWSVSVASQEGISLVVIRFPFFLFQFLFGISLGGLERPVMTPLGAVAFETGAVREAYQAWLAGAAVFALAFVLSVALYAAEERVGTLPLDPVRLMGGLLLLTAAPLTASSWLLWRHYPGALVPVGVVFLWAFGVVLIAVERT